MRWWRRRGEPDSEAALLDSSGFALVRAAAALGAGLAVFLLLSAGVEARPGSQTYPPPTSAAASATATVPATATPVAAIAAAGSIAGGRGRVVNVRGTSFTVLWTSTADSTGTVAYGISAVLTNTAADTRGAGFSGRAHYVDVTGLQPNTIYFFDLQSGSTVDNNGGQHYQVRTGPDLPMPPPGMAMVGIVLNAGGTSPAGGALVWGDVRDGNGRDTLGTSQFIGTLAGADGRFRLDLNPRVQDLTSYFLYSNSADVVDLFARAAEGEAASSFDSANAQNGGASPAEVRLLIAPFTPTPAAAALTPAVPAPAVATVVPPAVTATAPVAVLIPTSAPTAPLPVQLPSLREMNLAQVALTPAEPAPPVVAPAQAKPAAITTAPAPGSTLPLMPAGQTTGPVVPSGQSAPVAPAPAVQSPPNPAGAIPAPQAPPPTRVPMANTGLPAPSGASFSAQGGVPAGAVPAPIAQLAPTPTLEPLPSGLASMPPMVSLLLYSGITFVILGCGVAVYSLLSGPGWRPR